jgi:uncharacterized coiled-coil DUF342 family protein
LRTFATKQKPAGKVVEEESLPAEKEIDKMRTGFKGLESEYKQIHGKLKSLEKQEAETKRKYFKKIGNFAVKN